MAPRLNPRPFRRRTSGHACSLAVAAVLLVAAPSGGGRPQAAGTQDPPVTDLPPSLQPDRPLAPPAAPGSLQAEEAVRRHRELGMRIAGLLREAERLRTQSSTLLGELRRLEVERQLQMTRAAQADAAVTVIEDDLAALSARVDELERARTHETPAVVARLQRLQRLGRIGYARIAWGASSARELGRAARLMTRIAREDADRLLGYQETTAELTASAARLAARRDEAVAARAAATDALAAARRAAEERQALLARIAAERDQQLRLVEELDRAQRALDGAVAAYRPPDPSAPAGASTSVPVAPLEQRRRALPWPARGTVAQPFGRRRDPRFGTTVVRNGIDITAEAGTPVRAIHPGTVAFADTFEGFGRLVIVEHGGQAFSLYGYLSRTLVTPGTVVTAGEIVGEVGAAPAGGPAVYFELRVDGRPVDPLQWLERR